MGHPPGWVIRQTTTDDVRQLSRLTVSARWKHLHLDWIQPEQLAGQQPFLLALNDGSPCCALGCPPDPPQVAWIRVFAVASGVNLAVGWKALWEPTLDRLRQLQIQQTAALVSAGWMEPMLEGSGFQMQNEVIFMERRTDLRLEPPDHPGRLRRMQPADLAQVLAVDWDAFGLLWRFSAGTLQEALRLAARASVIELDGQVIGYHITTQSPFGGHLARLAVGRDWQARGLGRALVVDAINWVERRGLDLLSVNTQADNAPGQRLYRSLGFAESGQVFPVYVLPG